MSTWCVLHRVHKSPITEKHILSLMVIIEHLEIIVEQNNLSFRNAASMWDRQEQACLQTSACELGKCCRWCTCNENICSLTVFAAQTYGYQESALPCLLPSKSLAQIKITAANVVLVSSMCHTQGPRISIGNGSH
jgi:hypothetical protein